MVRIVFAEPTYVEEQEWHDMLESAPDRPTKYLCRVTSPDFNGGLNSNLRRVEFCPKEGWKGLGPEEKVKKVLIWVKKCLDMSTSVILNQCPFCGGLPKIRSSGDNVSVMACHWVECQGCGIKSSSVEEVIQKQGESVFERRQPFEKAIEELVENWNRRSNETGKGEGVKKESRGDD